MSTEDQATEGYSLGAQAQRLNGYVQAKEWVVAGHYVDDGYSGRDIKRPAYQRMFAEAESWDVLVVVKMDRIHRNQRNFTAMIDDLQQMAKDFVSITEAFDTETPMGRFVMDIMQRVAQLESEQIGDRVYTGMEQKARQGGGSNGGRTPYGYARGPGGQLTPSPHQAAIVLSIFQEYVDGGAKTSIVQRLKRDHRGRKWSIWAITRILENRAYVGDLVWADSVQRDAHPAIVARALFEQVQARLNAKRRGPPPEG